MRRGNTLLMPAGPQGWHHLWIVVTDPSPVTGLTVIVSVTTLRNALDQTLILRAGDHPFIRHDSAVFFGDARIVDGARLLELVAERRMCMHQPCATWLIDEVEAGIRASPYTPKKVLAFMNG